MPPYADVCPTNVARRLTDKGVDLRIRGHVHGGVEMSVRATTPPAGSLQLRSTYWNVEAEATASSLQALQVRTHAEARSMCAHSSCHDEVRRAGACAACVAAWRTFLALLITVNPSSYPYASMYQHTSAYVAYVSIRQHTSFLALLTVNHSSFPHASICRHTSAYVAYVSIRQHTSFLALLTVNPSSYPHTSMYVSSD